MNFYNSTHQHYCGIDLHARCFYVCIINQQGETLLHKEISANPDALIELISPYLDNLVLGVECMHCWYWVADFCDDHDIEFILGHALYMKAIHGGKTKNDRVDSFKIAALMRGGNFPLAYVYPRNMRATRDLLRRRTNLVRHGADLKAHVANTTSQYNLDMAVLECYHRELSQVEWFLEKQAKKHQPAYFYLLKTIPGIGRILAGAEPETNWDEIVTRFLTRTDTG